MTTPKHTELPENHRSIIELAHWANGGVEYDVRSCECDHESNQFPCRYCAIHTGLNVAIKLCNQHAELIRQINEKDNALRLVLKGTHFMTEDDFKAIRQALTPTKENK